MATVVAPSLADLVLDRVVEQLGRYREIVQRAASGWTLTEPEAQEAGKLLELLELPTWCLRRDVGAVRAMYAEDNERRRLELLWVYPHLFGDRRQWAELRRDDRAKRRRIMADIRRAMADAN
jgi:hypothetical protein